jgi:hypothetical protein
MLCDVLRDTRCLSVHKRVNLDLSNDAFISNEVQFAYSYCKITTYAFIFINDADSLDELKKN